MSNLPVKSSFQPIYDVPAAAPPPPVDLTNPHLSADDIVTKAYFSMESLQEWLADRNTDMRLLTVNGCTVEYIYDPVKDKNGENGNWRPVLWFEETGSGLPINVTRKQQLTKLAKSPLLSDWANVGQVVLAVGVFNGHAQIGVLPVPTKAQASTAAPVGDDYTAEDANGDLFG